MGSVDADVEIDMKISDNEQESSTERAVVGRAVVKQTSPGPKITQTDSTRKRKRSSPDETSPSVRVKYHNLSRESRKKLQELLRDWSFWQGYHGGHSSSESRDNRVENGEEQHYAALQVGPVGNSFSVSFWVDKPAKQSCSKEYGDSQGTFKTPGKDLGESESDVPLYDRVTPSLSTLESRKDGCIELEREASRCFNCGSYSHGLRDCQRKFNYNAINSARSIYASKRNSSSGPRSAQIRYYETNPNNEEPDRAPCQLHRTFPCDLGKETSRSSEKEEKNNKVPCTEEGTIVGGMESSCVEELYIAFSPDLTRRATPDSSRVRVPYNPVSERMCRSPPPSFSPPIQMHSNFHHQLPFVNPHRTLYAHAPSLLPRYDESPQRSEDRRHPQWSQDGRNLEYPVNNSSSSATRNGMNAPAAVHVSKNEDSWHPQWPWDGRNLHFPENNSSSLATMNGSRAPAATPVFKKEDATHPQWSWDGKTFNYLENNSSSIATVNCLSAPAAVQLPKNEDSGHLQWSWEGRNSHYLDSSNGTNISSAAMNGLSAPTAVQVSKVDERHPQQPWDGRHFYNPGNTGGSSATMNTLSAPTKHEDGMNLQWPRDGKIVHYPANNNSTPIINGLSTPTAVPVLKKEDIGHPQWSWDNRKLQFTQINSNISATMNGLGAPLAIPVSKTAEKGPHQWPWDGGNWNHPGNNNNPPAPVHGLSTPTAVPASMKEGNWHPQQPWDGRNLQYPENNNSNSGSTTMNGSNPTVAIPVSTKQDDMHPQWTWDGNLHYPSNNNSSSAAMADSSAPTAAPDSKEGEKNPQQPWEGRNFYYPENNMSCASMNGLSVPIAPPVSEVGGDKVEPKFGSAEYQSENPRSVVEVMGASERIFTPSLGCYPTLIQNTVSAFSPDPSQLPPTGSCYGDSFWPSQTPTQHFVSSLEPQVREPS